MPERLRARREGIDRILQHVLTGVVGESHLVNLDREDLWTLLDALPVAVLISTDRACTRIWGNAAARRLYQLPDGQNFSRTAPADELPPFQIYADGARVDPQDLPLQRAARTGEAVEKSECEIRFQSGRRIFIAGHCIPIRNAAGEVCGSVGAFLDLTPQRRELEMSQIISREMSHRVRNTVAIIQSIGRRTLRPALNAETYEAYEARLVAISKYQDLIYQKDWSGADLDEVVRVAVEGVIAHPSGRILTSGPPLQIPSTAALPLTMILHELATNTIKYGSLSVPNGLVQVTWEATRGAGVCKVGLRWAEAGGPPVSKPTQTGFGTSMIAAVGRALPKGSVKSEFAPGGLIVALSFELREEPHPLTL